MRYGKGRPQILKSGIDNTFTMSSSCLEVIQKGAFLLAEQTKQKQSRAAWVRYLIDSSLAGHEIQDTITAEQLHHHWPVLAPSPEPKMKATYRLDEEHLILLRKFECYTQSLDWHLPFYRNEALQLLVLVHGHSINTNISP